MKDDLPTVAAIGALAFISTDVAHEVIGHGIGLFLAGGRTGVLTTTRLIFATQLPDPAWRIFDLAGPLGNLTWALLCLGLQRLIRGNPSKLRFFLWAGMAFSLCWEFGYLMKCGVTGSGDGMALIEGLRPVIFWRSLLFFAGLGLYLGAIRLFASHLHYLVSLKNPQWRSRVTRLLWITYLVGGFVACAGPILDPRGPIEILRSGAASSLLACVGFILIPNRFPLGSDKIVPPENGIIRSIPLVILALIAVGLFVLLLGPGIRVSV